MTRAHLGAPATAHASDRPETGALMGAPRTTLVGAPRTAPAGAGKVDAAILRTQAKEALVGLGWKPAIAAAARTSPYEPARAPQPRKPPSATAPRAPSGSCGRGS